MKIIENKENLKSVLTVKISKEDYQPIVDKELKKTRQSVPVRGFRPGTAPMSMIKRMYEPKILQDEINKLLTDSLDNFFKDDTRKRIGQIIPSDENQVIKPEQEDFEFVFEAGFYPELEYRLNEETELPFYEIAVEPRHIEDRISNLRKQFSFLADSKKASEEDTIYASFIVREQQSDDVNDDNQKKYINFILSVIPDEYKPLFVGTEIDSAIEVELRKVFPNQTDLLAMLRMTAEELENLPETITLHINRIARYEPAELNQDFFDRIAEKDTIHNEEELKNHLTETSRTEYDNIASGKLVDDFREYAEKTLNLEIPEDFLVKFFRYIDQENDAENEAKIDRDMPNIVKQIKWNYIIETLLQRENIKVTEAEIFREAELEVINRLSMYNLLNKEYFDNFMKYTLDNKENIERFANQIKHTKLCDLLKQKITLNHTEISIEEFNRLTEEDVKRYNLENETKTTEIASATEEAETETAQEVETKE